MKQPAKGPPYVSHWREQVCTGSRHVLRVTLGDGTVLSFSSQSVDAAGEQGVLVCFAGLAGVTLPVSAMEVALEDGHVLLSGGAVGVSRRDHDGWKGFTNRSGSCKLLVAPDSHTVTGMRCAVHALAYSRHSSVPAAVASAPMPQATSRTQMFADWPAVVALRVDQGAGGQQLLWERRLLLRVGEVASEARQTLCLVPEAFEGAVVSRPLAAGEPDRLRLVADWALWSPNRAGGGGGSAPPVLHHSCYLWAQRHRQFPTLYEAVSLNHEGFGVRFTVQDPGVGSSASTSLVTSVTLDVTLPLMRDWLGVKQVSLRDVAAWIAAQRQL